MATYTQWRTATDAGDIRRVTWVCGDQRVLVEEVVDTMRQVLKVSELDYVSLSHGPQFERDVWAAVNQYPLIPGGKRLILIRDADKLTRWDQLGVWLTRTRSLTQVYLLFVSDQADLPTTTSMGKKTLKPHVAQLRAPRGSLVRCTMPAEPDAVAWVRRRAQLDDDTARYLLERTGGNLAAVAGVCAKLRLFTGAAGRASIDGLTDENPVHDLTHTLITGDKRRAMLCIPKLGEKEHQRLVALLDSRLDTLYLLNRVQSAGGGLRDAASVNPYLARQYLPYARDYDPATCSYRRRVLAVADDALLGGAHAGVFEALVALW